MASGSWVLNVPFDVIDVSDVACIFAFDVIDVYDVAMPLSIHLMSSMSPM